MKQNTTSGSRSHIASSYIFSLLGACTTSYELMLIPKASIVLAIVVAALFANGIISLRLSQNAEESDKKRKKQYGIMSFVCGGIILVITLVGVWQQNVERHREALLSEYIRAVDEAQQRAVDRERLKSDPAFQYEHAVNCQDRFEYTEAREYFQKTAHSGNGRAYFELAQMDIRGMGGPVNIHSALDNYIMARRIAAFYISNFRELSLYPELSEYEKQSLDATEEELQWLQGVRNRFHELSDEKDVLALLNQNADKLKRLALKGYRDAATLMYCRGIALMNNGQHAVGEDETHFYSHALFKMGIVPTEPIARWEFMRSYYGDDHPKSPYAEELLERNCYFPTFINEDIDYEANDDYSLIYLYKYSRSRLVWFRDLASGKVDPVSIGTQGSIPIERFVDEAENALNGVICEIQRRIDAMR